MPPRRDGAATPTTSPPPSPGGTTSASKGAGAGAAPPPSSPHPASKRPSAPGGIGTGDEAAATPPSSPRRGGSPPVASPSPAPVSCPASPRVHCGGRGSPPTASPPPASASCNTSPRVRVSLVELVATGHCKPAAGAHEEGGEVEKAMEDPVETPALSDSEKQLSSAPGGTGAVAAAAAAPPSTLDERETLLRRTHYTVPQDHATPSKWVGDVDADWTDRMAAVQRMEDGLRSETSRLKAKEKKGEEKGKGKGKEKEDGNEDNEREQWEGEHNHAFLGSGFFPWNAEPARDDASSALKQQPKLMPTPLDTPNPIIPEITAMTTRTSTLKGKVYHFESCLMLLRSESPKTYGICSFPSLGQITSESKDPEMVKIGLRVFTRSSENLDERRLYSTIHEILKAVVAKYNASQLLTQQERVRWEIRKILTDQAQNFGIAIDGVSIVSLSFEKVFTQDIQEKEVTTQEDEQGNRTTQEAGQDNRSAMIRSQDDDHIWNKRQIGYIFDLGTALGIVFLIRPWLPSGYDRWILAAFAAVWGMGSVGLPIGMFGTSRFEKNCSRHVGRFISLSFSLLVLYAIYILTLNVAGTPPTSSVSSFGITDSDGDGDGDGDADWWTTASFIVIAALVAFGHLCSWIRGCCTGGDRDMLP
ncbi:histone-lysine N-methyltransferase EHMT2-like [Triticum dicoccoides]|uniref:histone-lysine N-methyltransferase EHMT2-like n=1 Tax=Triticum dicoccoides TaxID=85692 RepID=UPI001890A7D9|nr:histone-lysine N-methyltransferase EHMT2-like [Triticum dicoccoides]